MSPPRSITSGHRDTAWAVALGCACALVVIGPGLQPGSLLSLDLLLTPRIPVPAAAWGLGPALPQRVPLGLPLAWVAAVVGGPTAGKALIAAAITLAVVGMVRLVAPAPPLVRAGAAVAFAIGPFATTRVGAGHLNVLAAYAILPWALRVLLRPADDPRRTFLWAAALAVTGSTGGALVAGVVAVGLVADRLRRWPTVIAACLTAQLTWIVPSAIALGSGASVAAPLAFPTRLRNPLDVLGLAAGGGFWRPSSQVGGPLLLDLAGAIILVLAALGARDVADRWGNRALAVGVLGFIIAASSGAWGVRSVYGWVGRGFLGAPFRESARALALFAAVAVPAVAFGAIRLAGALRGSVRAAVLALPLSIALVLAGPALWGIGGRLDPVDFPASWSALRKTVAAEPGTVLALPWHQYLDLSFAGGRRVLNPLPDYLGVDTISSFDPELGPPRQEQTDRRARGVTALVHDLQRGGDISPALVRLGVRWVVVVHEVDWATYRGLADDPGLAPVTVGDDLDLYRVRDWRGPLVDGVGRSSAPSSPIAPLALVDDPGGLAWQRPSGPGWLRGLDAVDVNGAGLLELPPGGRVVWFWPAVPAVLADALVAGSVLAVGVRVRRRARE